MGDDLVDLIAETLAAENVRLVGSHHGRWDEAAPAVAEAVRWHFQNLESDHPNPSSVATSSARTGGSDAG